MSIKQRIPLAKAQREILSEFYQVEHTRVIFTKSERHNIWLNFKIAKKVPSIALDSLCPALLAELEKSISSDHLIQSAVFSECVYAQTLANMIELTEYFNFANSPGCLSGSVTNLITSYHMKPRYVYKSPDGRRALIQAGGFGGVDSALISIEDNNLFTIEFKEPGSKTSEPDLPPYGEDGFLVSSPEFLGSYSHFEKMLTEQLDKRLNFWEVMGSNINDFEAQSVQIAVSENYAAKKFADVICVEDTNGYLTMIPANQAGLWADIRGEIRPAGRNPYSVWTPEKLTSFITALGGRVEGESIFFPLAAMVTAKRRGGNEDIGRFKINPLFFVRADDVEITGDEACFKLNRVKQLRPTISAHMFFKGLEVTKVHDYYRSEF